MRLDQLTLLIESDNISQVSLHPAPMHNGKWIIHFERKTGEVVPLTARRENVRHFASVDSALKVLNELGIKTATIDWS